MRKYMLYIIVFMLLIFLTENFLPINAAGSGDVQKYTVKSGDSLYLISKQYGTTVNKLKSVNGLKSDMIMPGQVLWIPISTAYTTKYTVKSGDTLFLIAKKFGTTVTEIKWANALRSDMILIGSVLRIPVNQDKPLRDMLINKGISLSNAKIEIRVDKSDHVLGIFSNGTWLKSYHVELGDGGSGDKQYAGDHRTPEGTFYISQLSVLSPVDEYLGSRWMRLSYPNIEDAERGLKRGIITRQEYDAIVTSNKNGTIPLQQTSLGGGVGIHGGDIPEFGSDWTWGCVGLTNNDVEDFYNFVQVGTRVVIQK